MLSRQPNESPCHPLRRLFSQVPKSIPSWQAAFIEPLACAIHGVELGEIQLSDAVVIAGCGPVGLGMVATARLKNPHLLIALDLFDWKVCGSCVCLWRDVEVLEGSYVTLYETPCRYDVASSNLL